MDHFRFLILGAGPTGLGAARRLKELGEEDFLVIEKSSGPGGLSASFTDSQGFTWDIGGHVQFSHYRYFDELMDEALGADGWLTHQRESWAWIQGRFVPYPVQNNIRYLPQDTLWACLDGIISANLHRAVASPNNFKDWLLSRFGSGLAEAFLFPYNWKVWACPLDAMSYQWVGERVATADLRRVVRNILFGQDDLSWGPNNTFRFPRRGGTGAIWTKVAELIGSKHFCFGSKVEQIDSSRRVVCCAGGREYAYERLISTIPVNQCASLLVPGEPEIRNAAGQLRYSSSNIVGLGLKGQPRDCLRTKCWMYYPESNCPFYRVTVFSNYSPNNVPDARLYWSLMTETSESEYKPVDQNALIEDTIQGCLNTGLIESRSQVVSTWQYRAQHGYPTPTLQRDDSLRLLLPALAEKDIYSRGRFGAWKYEVSNQDHSFMQGVELVNRLLLDVPETTVYFPEIANANWGRL